MPSKPSAGRESCLYCPHHDDFHGTCTHPFRQIIIEDSGRDGHSCPLFPEIRAEAMRDLQRRME